MTMYFIQLNGATARSCTTSVMPVSYTHLLIGTPPTEPKTYFKAAVVAKNLPDMQKELRNLRKEVEELKQLLNK